MKRLSSNRVSLLVVTNCRRCATVVVMVWCPKFRMFATVRDLTDLLLVLVVKLNRWKRPIRISGRVRLVVLASYKVG